MTQFFLEATLWSLLVSVWFYDFVLLTSRVVG
jgi:hypothetical protein